MLEGIVQLIVNILTILFNVISGVADFITNQFNIARDFSLIIVSAIFAWLISRPQIIQSMFTVGLIIFLLVLFIIGGGVI